MRRLVYRLRQNSVWIGDCKTVEELGRKVDLSTLAEDPDDSDQPAEVENGEGPA
jgi:hypothetical protein